MKKKTVLALLLAAALLLLTACGNNVEGTWRLKSGAMLGIPSAAMNFGDMVDITMTLKSGKMTMNVGGAQTLGFGVTLDSTYSIKGSRITIDPITMFGTTGEAVTYEFKVEGKTMTFTGEGRTIVFEKEQ